MKRRLRLKQGILPTDWCPRHCPPRRRLVDEGGSLRILPLRTYRYDEARAIVEGGQRVQAGQPLSRPEGLLSRVRLAPVSGGVRAVENRRLGDGALVPCVILEVDPGAPAGSALDPDTALAAQGLENQQGLPLDLELSLMPEGGVLLLNGAETEQGHWSLMAHLEDLAGGAPWQQALELLLDRIRPARVYLSHRAAQRKAAEALVDHLSPRLRPTRLELDNSHPGAHPLLLAEKASALAGRARTLSAGRPLASQGVLVLDLDRFRLLQQRLTLGPGDTFLLSLSDLTGEGEVLELPVGLPLDRLVDHRLPVFAGGALGGRLLKDPDSPLAPPLRALALARDGAASHREEACITCGRCLEACPRQLAPPRLVHLIEELRLREARRMGLEDCLLCGVCTFVCPSRINLAHSLAKGRWLLGEGRHERA
jgi:electron transport complex protein RnfC